MVIKTRLPRKQTRNVATLVRGRVWSRLFARVASGSRTTLVHRWRPVRIQFVRLAQSFPRVPRAIRWWLTTPVNTKLNGENFVALGPIKTDALPQHFVKIVDLCMAERPRARKSRQRKPKT